MRNLKKPNWIVAGVIVLLIGGFVVGVWLPERKQRAAQQSRIAEAETALGPRDVGPATMARRQRQIDALQTKLSDSERTVPHRPDLAAVLRSLTEAVEAEGVAGQRFELGEPAAHRHYTEVPIELEFERGFPSAFAVLRRIEALPRLVRVDALNLRLLDDDGEAGGPRTAATLRLSSFYTADEEGS
ncbi:MAG: type 4a pilus biogenesis protein PilO [Planctomycetota bacterium]